MIRWIQIGVLSLLLCCAASVADAARQQSESPTPQSQSATDQSASGSAQNSTDTGSKNQAPPPPQEPPDATSQPGQAAPPSGSQATAKDAEPAPNKPVTPPGAHSGRKKPAKPGTKPQPGKVVVRNGGARDSSVQLNPVMTQDQALHSKENTAQLLLATDATVKAFAGRQVSRAQQSTLAQIRSYIRQSKAASASGDLGRAHTLAFKAHLLSDELARQ